MLGARARGLQPHLPAQQAEILPPGHSQGASERTVTSCLQLCMMTLAILKSSELPDTRGIQVRSGAFLEGMLLRDCKLWAGLASALHNRYLWCLAHSRYSKICAEEITAWVGSCFGGCTLSFQADSTWSRIELSLRNVRIGKYAFHHEEYSQQTLPPLHI